MSDIKIIYGEIFTDPRGTISSLNAFDFKDVERFYFIHHSDTSTLRGWHGHQYEKKWFYCVKGSFNMAFIRPDNWENPSVKLQSDIYHLTDKDSKIICVPEGYVNCLRAKEKGSILMVYSGKKYPECLDDSWRWSADTWGGDKL